MAINSCTIDSFTLDAFCSPRRGMIFDRLVDELHPVTPVVSSARGNPRVLRDTFQMPRPFEIDDRQTLTFEQPFVTVTAEILGLSGTDTQDVQAANTDFVTVTGLDFGSDETQISVNILDIHFG